MIDPDAAITEFIEAARAAGIEMPDQPEADGKLHRYHVEGDSRGSKSGWYALHLDPIAAGAFGCWRRGLNEKWRSGEYQKLDEADRQRVEKRLKEARECAEAKLRKIQAAAARKACEIVDQSVAADPEHPYLKGKHIGAHDIRQESESESGKLVVPVRDDDGNITSVQRIDGEGNKRFLGGGRVAGCSFAFGDPGKAADIYLCEGVATGATMHEVTGKAVVCAFNAGNLEAVGTALCKSYPDARIIICADDDAWDRSGMPRCPSENTGLMKAREAAAACNAIVVSPDFPEPAVGLTDYNDLASVTSKSDVAAQIQGSIRRELAIRRAVTLGDAEYAIHRKSLKKEIGVNLKDLDSLRSAGRKPEAAQAEAESSMADRLIKIGMGAELFTSPSGEAFATVQCDGHLETYGLKSGDFGSWLRGQLFALTKKGVTDTTLSLALATLDAAARHGGATRPVYIRTAREAGKIYIDLCDEDWRAVEIDSSGYRVVSDPPVCFTRRHGMLPLPEPERGGKIDEFWGFVNIGAEQRPLVAGFIVSSLRGDGPYFNLNLHATQGTCKSVTTRLIRGVIDPNDADLGRFPKSDRDFAISANSQFVPTFDNMSALTADQSDLLCCLATNGAIRTRSLFSDCGETTMKLYRPSIINGIPNVVTRSDLAARSISIELKPIPGDRRREEQEIFAEFAEAKPRILGAIYEGIAHALAHTEECREMFDGEWPRMKDAALFAISAEESFGFETGEFINQLQLSHDESGDDILESDPIAPAIIAIAERDGGWDGSCAALLEEIREISPEKVVKSKRFPPDATRLSNRLGRIEIPLRTRGVQVERPPRVGKARTIILRLLQKEKLASPSVTSVATLQNKGDPVTLGDASDATELEKEPLEHVTI